MLSSRIRAVARPLALLVALALAACAGGSASAPPGFAAAVPTVNKSAADRSAIAHVIVVVLENRSFDNVFHFYDHAKADIGDTGLDSKNNVVTLQPRSFTEQADAGHGHGDFVKQFNGGLNNGWVGTSSDARPYYMYGYLPKTEIQPYLDIASEFAISDRFFHGVQAPTFPSHVEIGASTTFGVIGNPSVQIPWGCDAAAGTITSKLGPGGVEVPGPFPCFDGLSIFDLLDRKGVTWRYYAEPEGLSAVGNNVIPAMFRSTRYGSDYTAKVAKSDKEINAALTAGTLPQVSYVIPDETSTDHAGTPSLGPTYVANLVNALGASSYYNNTLMIVTWDDWGGWYDHVTPKQLDATSLSYRKPVLFIGGYVKRGFVSHVETEDSSINKYLEQQFGLDSLGQHDVRAASFDDVLDFSQPPHPFVPINPAIVYAPTSLNPNFRVRSSALLGKVGRSERDFYAARTPEY